MPTTESTDAEKNASIGGNPDKLIVITKEKSQQILQLMPQTCFEKKKQNFYRCYSKSLGGLFSFFYQPGILKEMSWKQIISHGLGKSTRTTSNGETFKGLRTQKILNDMGVIALNTQTKEWEVTNKGWALILSEKTNGEVNKPHGSYFKTDNDALQSSIDALETAVKKESIQKYWSDPGAV